MTKRGPNTERGKAASRRNAWKHGILSGTMAIAPFEDEDKWEAHRDGVIEDRKPEGHLEHMLVERIAIALWKLRRLEAHQATLTYKYIGESEIDLFRGRAEGDILLRRPVSKEPIPEDDVHRAEMVRTFPPPDEMALILRYEAHYHRLCIQTLHELEAIQIRRKGGTSPLARLDITGAPGG